MEIMSRACGSGTYLPSCGSSRRPGQVTLERMMSPAQAGYMGLLVHPGHWTRKKLTPFTSSILRLFPLEVLAGFGGRKCGWWWWWDT